MNSWECRLGFDPNTTWGPGSRGSSEGIFISRYGEPIRAPWRLWDVGSEAYKSVVKDALESFSALSVDELDEMCTKILKMFREVGFDMSRRIDSKEFRAKDPNGDRISGENIRKSDPLNMARFIGQLLNYPSTLAPPPADILEELATCFGVIAIYTLSDIESALAMVGKSPDRIVDMYADARDMMEYSDLAHRTLLQRKAGAKAAAAARHSENRQMKQEALDYYIANKDQFRSRAAAAREITRIVPVTERSIYTWLTDYEKSKS